MADSSPAHFFELSMNRFPFLRPQAMWLPAAWLLGGLAQAQTLTAPAELPADALTYRSALADYQPYQAQPVRPWRETNDEVSRIGGWRAYAREAAGGAALQAQPAGAAAPASVSTPAPQPADPHAGHHGSQP